MARRILFIYRGKRGICSAVTVHRKLHGQRAVRTSTDEFGRTFHKTYEYPGIPHQDVIPGVIAVEPPHERRVAEMFEKYSVPYIRARAEGRWGAHEGCPDKTFGKVALAPRKRKRGA